MTSFYTPKETSFEKETCETDYRLNAQLNGGSQVHVNQSNFFGILCMRGHDSLSTMTSVLFILGSMSVIIRSMLSFRGWLRGQLVTLVRWLKDMKEAEMEFGIHPLS